MAGSLAAYAGIQPTWKREGPIYSCKIDTAESGAEVRTVWGDPPTARYRYTAEIILQASEGDITSLMGLIEDNYGSGDSWTLTDPITNGSVTVRLESPPVLSQYRGVSGWWSTQIVAISVIG